MCNSYRKLKYDTWNNFKGNIARDLCGSAFFPEKKYIFRGQRNQDWLLVTSFDRAFGHLEFETRRKIEKSLQNEFRNRCKETSGNGMFDKYNDIQVLSLGQHYGLPTRLLDWSYSLYVAAFFAFAYSKNDYSDNVVIWALDMDHQIWQGDYGVEIVTSKIDENEYQKYQKAIFTLNKTPYVDIQSFVQACNDRCNTDGALTQILIPYNERNIVLNDLEMMSINHMNLFPGFEGCAQTALLKEFVNNNLN